MLILIATSHISWFLLSTAPCLVTLQHPSCLILLTAVALPFILINMILVLICCPVQALHPAQLRVLQGPKYGTGCLLQRNTVNFHTCRYPDYLHRHGLAPPYIADLCRPVTSVGRRQRLRSATRGDLGQLLRHALRLSCIHCGGPKGMEPAASTFTSTRDSWPLQDGIKDLSLLHPVTVRNCLTRRTLVMTLFMLRRVRNCRRYITCTPSPIAIWHGINSTQ